MPDLTFDEFMAAPTRRSRGAREFIEALAESEPTAVPDDLAGRYKNIEASLRGHGKSHVQFRKIDGTLYACRVAKG